MTATKAQAMEALAKANKIRLAKAQLKNTLRTRSADEARKGLIERIMEWDRVIATFSLREIAHSVKYWDRETARKLALFLGSPSVDDRVDDLTDDQLGLLLRALDNPKLFIPGHKKKRKP